MQDQEKEDWMWLKYAKEVIKIVFQELTKYEGYVYIYVFVQRLSAITPKKRNTDAEMVFLSAKNSRIFFEGEKQKAGWERERFCARSFVSVKYLRLLAFISSAKERYKNGLFISSLIRLFFILRNYCSFSAVFMERLFLQKLQWLLWC